MKAKILLLLVVLLLPVFALAEPIVVENDQLMLTIDDQSLVFTVTDKATGAVLNSNVDTSKSKLGSQWVGFMESTLVIDVTSGTATAATRVDPVTAGATTAVTPVENGLDVVVDFTEQGQRITLQIRLEGDSLSMTVPADGIEEYGETSIAGLYLAPCLGATYLAETEGYILIPEASGAIINFSDGKNSDNTPFNKRIYGTNIGVDNILNTELNRPAEQITLPVYGLTHTAEGIGYLAVVEAGDATAEILAYPAGVITDYNWVSSRFTMREEYIMQTTRTEGLRSRESKANMRDLTVRFYFLTGEEATYAGMARRYRSLLEERGQLKQTDVAYRPRIDFLGAEAEKFLLWDTLVPMTTIDQVSSIVDAYLAEGLTPPLAIYRGWMGGGLSKNYGSGNISLESALGSEKDLMALQNKINAAGGQLLLEIDPVQANTGRLYNMRLDIVRTIGQTVKEIWTGKDLYPTFYYLTPSRTAEILRSYQERYQGSFSGISVMTLPNTLYSYYSAGKTYSREATEAQYSAALAQLDGMTVALENPIAPYFGNMDIYLDLRLEGTAYSFISAEVPFLPLVLSGDVPYYSTWTNFDANQQKLMLKLVEYGAYPSFIVTGEDVQKLTETNSNDMYRAKWDVMQETVLTMDAGLNALHAKLAGSRMVDHQVPAEDVAVVTWSNGVRIVVNYTAKDYVFEGQTVPARSYLVVEGGVQP